MEIVIPGKHKKAIYPILVFKEAWGICRKNLGKLSVTYLIFNLPIAAIYLTPMASKLQDQKPNLSTFLGFFLPVLILSIWGHIALLLGARKAVDFEGYKISQNINQTSSFFLKYLGTVLLAALSLMGIMILGGLSVAMILAMLSKVNKILAASICLGVVILTVMSLIYFMLRWSLATTVCVLENIRPVTALKRSFSLVMEYVHPVVGTYCLILVIYVACLLPFIVIASLFGIGGDTEQANRVGTIYSIIINIVLVPFWSTITVVLYKKLKEALENHVHA
ncbi:MAG: hypothetical protein PHR73_03275 [Candidatus Omnitrophica bacterium]|nr:hypothetical protein [Candidatus Omnitrophota bacterium]